jgi:6-phosphofructokinase
MQINQYSINIFGINLKMMRKIGVFTSGGDSPGMNAAIRAVVRTALYNKVSVVGILNGYQGMIDGLMHELSFSDVGNIIQRGGTFLGSARSKDFLSAEGRALAYNNLKRMEIDGLIVIGGDGRVRLYDKTTDNALSTEESMVMLKQGKRMSSDTEGNNDNEEEFTFS